MGMNRTLSRTAVVRMDGASTRVMLAVALLVSGLALGVWTLLAGSGDPATIGGVGATHADAAPSIPAPAFRYADTPDTRLFRVAAARQVAMPAPGSRAGIPISISRQAALAAAHRGTLDVELPGGARYPVRYERSESAPGGNWTFVGRVDTVAGDLAAVITFGKDGVFGLLPVPDGTMMKITTRAGKAYLKPAGGVVPPGVNPAAHPDFVLATGPGAMDHVPGGGGATGGATAPAGQAATVGQAASDAAGEVTIDLLAAYTTNLVDLRGSASAVETEYQSLVAITNQAHLDSGSRARFAIADFVEVGFPAGGLNQTALYAMRDNGIDEDTDIHALRDAAAADLVALIRPYAEGDPTCGIAFVLGASLDGYSMSPGSGYSVTAVEDCGPLVLAHELGHNLGLMHDRETVTGQYGGTLGYGAFPFSFGYRQDGPPAFATVMAYDVREQVRINRFSHPGTTLCEGVRCGTEDRADNVRSINLTAGTTSRFRDPPGTISVLDSRVLEGSASGVSATFLVRLSSPAPAGGVNFEVALGGGAADPGEYSLGNWHTSIPEGYTEASFEVRTVPDTIAEPAETILVQLRNVQGMEVFDGEAIVTIVDDDTTVPVDGRLRFPPGIRLPTDDVLVYVRQVVDGASAYLAAWATPPDFRYRFDVARGATLELSANGTGDLIEKGVTAETVNAAMSGFDLPLHEGVRLSGVIRAQDTDELYVDFPLILWNPRGDGYGYYVNGPGGWFGYGAEFGMNVLQGSPMQLEARSPPAPYVRQLVEVPPLRSDLELDVQLRTVPSLTIAHVLVDEGSEGDGPTAVTMTAELSVPAGAGGVTFDVEAAGTAEADDFVASTGTFHIPDGQSTAEFAVTVVGDDRSEPDESVELRITNLQGAAWNPGPGSVRIVNDDPHVVASDFDGDGMSDVLWRNYETGVNGIWRAADYGRQMPITGVTNLEWEIVGTGDFDGDGTSGVVWRNRVTGANVIWRSARFADPIRVASVGNTDWDIVAVADFNGNGKDDLLWFNATTRIMTIWEAARHQGQGSTAREVGDEWRVAGTGDFDGDGREDILWRSVRTGNNVAWGGGDDALRSRIEHAGLDWELAAVGDFDGDDNDDIVWRNRMTGGNVLWPRADGASPRTLYGVTDLSWQIDAAGDYDGDGIADLFWRNAETGTNVVWHGAAATDARRPVAVRNLAWQVVP